jgi:hypothetical protein
MHGGTAIGTDDVSCKARMTKERLEELEKEWMFWEARVTDAARLLLRRKPERQGASDPRLLTKTRRTRKRKAGTG